jgi:vacuolar-type H+-ATPase subunit I/STV1
VSRAYRISVSESVRRHVRVEDGVCTSLELLEVLPKESMAELLAKELEGRGFKRDGDKVIRTEEDGVQVEVDLKDGSIKVKLVQEAELESKVERTQALAEITNKAKEALRKSAKATAEQEVDDKRERLRSQVTSKLEKRLADLQQEIDQVTHRVTAEALKVRASQLGEIEEITEDPETGSMTIKVRT